MITSTLQTQPIARNQNRAQLFAHVIGRAVVNSSAERCMLPWLLLYFPLCVIERKTNNIVWLGNA